MSPSPRSSTAVDVRHALRMVAHRPSTVASRPAASRRIRRGYLRCISSYAIWLAAVITLANESHARVTRWKVEITMANFCFAGEWLCQCWNGTYSRQGGAAEQSTHAPTAAHGAATPSSTGARSRPGLPGWAVLEARGQSTAPRPHGRCIAASPSRCARDRRRHLHRATM